MSHAWLKKYLKMKPEVTKIFEDLEDFKLFCADFGHSFNEAYLYNKHNQVWKDYQNIIKGPMPIKYVLSAIADLIDEGQGKLKEIENH